MSTTLTAGSTRVRGLLGRVSMYRLVLGALGLLTVISLGLAFAGLVVPDPLEILVSAVVLALACGAADLVEVEYEPLSALDEFLRLRMRSELKSLQNELGITFVHVTHTQPEAIALARLSSAQQILTHLAGLFADVYGLDADAVLEGLEQRELLGSTGFGRGVAIPHCRSAAIGRPTIALLKLDQPVDFKAADAIPVSLVFGLVSPENAGATHLHALAAISRLVRDEAMLGALSDAPDAEALYALLTNQFLRDAA